MTPAFTLAFPTHPPDRTPARELFGAGRAGQRELDKALIDLTIMCSTADLEIRGLESTAFAADAAIDRVPASAIDVQIPGGVVAAIAAIAAIITSWNIYASVEAIRAVRLTHLHM
jgi:hypothetical protein